MVYHCQSPETSIWKKGDTFNELSSNDDFLMCERYPFYFERWSRRSDKDTPFTFPYVIFSIYGFSNQLDIGICMLTSSQERK